MPAIALSIGVTLKILLNIVLVPMPANTFFLNGATGAAFATAVCHIIAFIIGFSILKRNIKLNLNITKYILKPISACFLMSMSLVYSYKYLNGIIEENMAIIISLIFAVVIYTISLFLLKIFRKDDIKTIIWLKR